MNNWFYYKVRDERRLTALLQFRKQFIALVAYNNRFCLFDKSTTRISGGIQSYIRENNASTP